MYSVNRRGRCGQDGVSRLRTIVLCPLAARSFFQFSWNGVRWHHRRMGGAAGHAASWPGPAPRRTPCIEQPPPPCSCSPRSCCWPRARSSPRRPGRPSREICASSARSSSPTWTIPGTSPLPPTEPCSSPKNAAACRCAPRTEPFATCSAQAARPWSQTTCSARARAACSAWPWTRPLPTTGVSTCSWPRNSTGSRPTGWSACRWTRPTPRCAIVPTSSPTSPSSSRSTAGAGPGRTAAAGCASARRTAFSM